MIRARRARWHTRQADPLQPALLGEPGHDRGAATGGLGQFRAGHDRYVMETGQHTLACRGHAQIRWQSWHGFVGGNLRRGFQCRWRVQEHLQHRAGRGGIILRHPGDQLAVHLRHRRQVENPRYRLQRHLAGRLCRFGFGINLPDNRREVPFAHRYLDIGADIDVVAAAHLIAEPVIIQPAG